MTGPVRIAVGVAPPYDVVIAPGLLDELAAVLPPLPHARRAALVTTGDVRALYADRVTAGLRARGLGVESVIVPDGEEAKTLATVTTVYHRLAAMRLGRDDVVVALGGGVIGDLAGFAAATWNRGVAVVQLPTTLLAQVDAAIGGKTGVNLAEGKNLVGAFHQPLAVVADIIALASLPARELRAGLGEAVKYGFIADPAVLDLLERDPKAAVAGDPEVLGAVVQRGVAVKARIVAADEREAGERALLNYGHTFGHAFEVLTGYGTYRHGEAVALGMVAAARLGERLGVSEPGLTDRTVGLLAPLGLPTGGLRLDPAAVWEVLGRDKKARDGVRFVLCRTPGDACLVGQPDRRLVEEVLRSLL
ncbi:MAG: 3-dehydroquinate synthase [Euzebyaceae bacterium]|jgi:3-dehydroquinate synthase|nr:3-dehydroquinate synthase [Euzebyaceae bacterium]